MTTLPPSLNFTFYCTRERHLFLFCSTWKLMLLFRFICNLNQFQILFQFFILEKMCFWISRWCILYFGFEELFLSYTQYDGLIYSFFYLRFFSEILRFCSAEYFCLRHPQDVFHVLDIKWRTVIQRRLELPVFISLQEVTLWRQNCLHHIFTYNHNFFSSKLQFQFVLRFYLCV
jgi:hypothetical protein